MASKATALVLHMAGGGQQWLPWRCFPCPQKGQIGNPGIRAAGHLSYFQNNIQEIYSTQKCAEHWLPLGTQRAQKPQVATKKGQNGTDVCQKSQKFLGVGVAPPNDASSSKQLPSKQPPRQTNLTLLYPLLWLFAYEKIMR